MSRPSISTLADLQAVRDVLLGRAVEVLRADSRVAAVWLSGSCGRGVEDAWSDLDLHVAVDDDAFSDFWEAREHLYQRLGPPLLIQPEMPSNAQHGGRFQLVVFPGPIEVDWNVGPLRLARRPPETVMLVERQAIPVDIPVSLSVEVRRKRGEDALVFFWAMAPIAVKYAGRSVSRRACSQIDLLTGSYIQLWRLVHLPDGPDPFAAGQNRATEAELDACLPRLGAVITPEVALDVIVGLCAAVQALHHQLEEMGVKVPTDMPAAVVSLIALARQAVRHEHPPGAAVYR